MLRLCLKVLLSVFLLMFSASVGLSAVYECHFKQQVVAGPADGRMLIDTDLATIYISDNNWWQGNINGSHKIRIDGNGSVFSWTRSTVSSHYLYKIRLDSPNSATDAHLTVTRASGMKRVSNKARCNLIKSDIVASVSIPTETEIPMPNTPDALEAVFLMQQAFDRRNIQLILSDLSFYKSTIDGLYGSGTESALYTYNDEYFRGSDLTKEDNVNALFEDILSQRVVEVKEPASLDNLIEQIDEIVGGELEPGAVDVSN